MQMARRRAVYVPPKSPNFQLIFLSLFSPIPPIASSIYNTYHTSLLTRLLQKFTWEGPNDTKLLLLTQGRYVKPEEYDSLSKAMGTFLF
jgi:hypothetical protein